MTLAQPLGQCGAGPPSGAVGIAHQGAQQVRDFQHPALPPCGLLAWLGSGGPGRRAAAPTRLVEAQGAQVGSLHHGHGVLHARWNHSAREGGTI